MSDSPDLSGLSTEDLSLGQPRRAAARRTHPSLLNQFIFPRQRTLKPRTAGQQGTSTVLPYDQVQQPLTPPQWHLSQQCRVSSWSQGRHRCNGIWLSQLCSHADLRACEQTTAWGSFALCVSPEQCKPQSTWKLLRSKCSSTPGISLCCR